MMNSRPNSRKDIPREWRETHDIEDCQALLSWADGCRKAIITHAFHGKPNGCILVEAKQMTAHIQALDERLNSGPCQKSRKRAKKACRYILSVISNRKPRVDIAIAAKAAEKPFGKLYDDLSAEWDRRYKVARRMGT